MRPLEKIYWLRLGLGIIAALVCVSYVIVVNGIPDTIDPFPADTSLFFNSVSIAIVTYLISYYVLKMKFRAMVQKPQKLVTTGIGIYLISWIVFWVFFYTILVELA